MATYLLDPSPTLLLKLGLTDDKDQQLTLYQLAETCTEFLNAETFDECTRAYNVDSLKREVIFSYLAQENVLISMYINSDIFSTEKILKGSNVIHVGETLEKTYIDSLLRKKILINGKELPYELQSKKNAIELNEVLQKYLALKKSFQKRMCV